MIEGFPFRLVDTAGLRESEERIERIGIAISKRYLETADLILFCRDSDDDVLPDAGTTPVVEVVTNRSRASAGSIRNKSLSRAWSSASTVVERAVGSTY